jgi:predicted MFS family arabinose efflux permease
VTVLVTSGLCCAANTFGYWQLVPLLPTVGHDLGLRADSLGLLWGLGPGFSGILMLPAGIAMDRFGRRPFLVVGTGVTVVALVARALASSSPWFAVAQVAFGLSGPMMVSASFTLAADAHEPRQRPAALGWVQMAFSLGQILGNLFGGAVGPAIGWRTMSLVTAVIPLALLIPAMRVPEPARARPWRLEAEELGHLRSFLADRFILAVGGFTMLGFGATAAAQYLLPFLVHDQGLGPEVASLLMLPFLGASVVGAPLAGSLQARIGMSRALQGLLLGAIGAVLVIAALPHVLPVLVAGYLLLGLASTPITTFAASMFADHALRTGRAGVGTAFGASRLGQAVGSASAPPVSGSFYVGFGGPAAFLSLAALLAASLVLVVVAARSGRG